MKIHKRDEGRYSFCIKWPLFSFNILRMKIPHHPQHHILIGLLLIFSELGDSSETSSTKVRRRRSKLCLPGQDACGSLCYDYNYYSCHEGPTSRRRFLCYKDEFGCGEKCYDPSEHNCYSSDDRDSFILCPWNERKCETKCYNPKYEICLRGKVIIAKNDNPETRVVETRVRPSYSSAGGSGNNDRNLGLGTADDFFNSRDFNNRDNKFIDDRSSASCPKYQVLCGFKCYDPSKQTCFRETSGSTRITMLCPVGNKRCNNYCYDPYRESCSQDAFNDNANNEHSKPRFHSSSNLVRNECPRGKLPCDGYCYNPYEEECTSKKKVKNPDTGNGPDGFVRVSTRHEYSSSSSNSGYPGSHGQGHRHGEVQDRSLVASPSLECRRGHLKCGSSCYDPNREECLSRGHGQFQRCESGSEVCGTKCYDPFNEKCLGDGGNGKVICRWNERACGSRCYDPFREHCH